MDRRQFLRQVSIASGGALLPVLAGCGSSTAIGIDPRAGEAAFLHGVASGDPLSDRVILWTRVTPEGEGSLQVRYRVATDPAMTQVLIDERVFTDADRDYTVKVDPLGLQPGTTYYYQFEVGTTRSPVGRTRTLPVGAVDHLRLGMVSCSSLAHGWFNAYRLLAQRSDIDCVLHLGDYIYEYGNGEYGSARDYEPPTEILTLSDYRMRYAQYRRDEDLAELHRQHPMICIWDDHESANNAWVEGAENHTEGAEGNWLLRKAESIQAYFEWMPIRMVDTNDPQRIWRQFQFGDLLDLLMLDTRLYGRDEPLLLAVGGPRVNSPDRQLLGAPQQAWLTSRLNEASAQWKFIGQQIMFGQLRLLTLPEVELLGVPLTRELLAINGDQWDGYAAARQRVFDAIDAGQVENVVVLTGDIHSSWGIELYRDPGELVTLLNNITGNPLDLGLIKASAVEFVTPSVTSPGFPAATTPLLRTLFRAVDPHIQYFQGDRNGYVVLDINRDRCQCDWWYVDTIAERGGGESFGHALFSRSGENRLRRADAPSPARTDAPPLAP